MSMDLIDPETRDRQGRRVGSRDYLMEEQRPVSCCGNEKKFNLIGHERNHSILQLWEKRISPKGVGRRAQSGGGLLGK